MKKTLLDGALISTLEVSSFRPMHAKYVRTLLTGKIVRIQNLFLLSDPITVCHSSISPYGESEVAGVCAASPENGSSVRPAARSTTRHREFQTQLIKHANDRRKNKQPSGPCRLGCVCCVRRAANRPYARRRSTTRVEWRGGSAPGKKRQKS